jgi:hypothetical protein
VPPIDPGNPSLRVSKSLGLLAKPMSALEADLGRRSNVGSEVPLPPPLATPPKDLGHPPLRVSKSLGLLAKPKIPQFDCRRSRMPWQHPPLLGKW